MAERSGYVNEDYDDVYREPSEYEIGRDECDYKILSRMRLKPGSSIIEVGCGNGRFLNKLKGFQLTGVDTSGVGINICRGKIDGDFWFCDIMDFPIKRFDYLFCLNSLEHFKNPGLALDKFKLLADEIYITVPNADLDTYSGHTSYWTIDEFKEFVSAHLEIIQCELFDSDQNIFLHAK